jgi:YD repeat-containing protein
VYRRKYDEYGNLIERRHYGVDEQLKEDEDGIAIYRYKYDEYGNKTETKRYDKREWPIGE